MRHATSCAIFDPCPSACDCNALTDYQLGYQAGAASRDAEIAELKAWNSELIKHQENTADKCEELQTQLAESQARDDDAARWRWVTRHGRMRGFLIPANEPKKSIDAAIDKVRADSKPKP
jgi:hypothetical protein